VTPNPGFKVTADNVCFLSFSYIQSPSQLYNAPPIHRRVSPFLQELFVDQIPLSSCTVYRNFCGIFLDDISTREQSGRAMRKIRDSPDIDSSGETGKTPSGPTLHDRPGPEMEITACPPVHPSSSTQTLQQTTFSTGHNRGIAQQTNQVFT